MMGQLVGGKADMALFPLTLTSLRSKYISATSPFMDNGYALLVKLEIFDTGYSFLLPFQVRGRGARSGPRSTMAPIGPRPILGHWE